MKRWQRRHVRPAALAIVCENGNLFFYGFGFDVARSLGDAGNAMTISDRWAIECGHDCKKAGCKGWRCTRKA